MKNSKLVVAIIVAIASILGFSVCGFGQDYSVIGGDEAVEGNNWVPGEIIVKFKPGVSDDVIAKINRSRGTSVIKSSRFAGFKRLRIPHRKSVADMVAIYKQNPNVEYAEPNFIAHAFMVPNDPYYTYQWNMDQINMELAWNTTSGDISVTVAVIDTGVAYENYQEPGEPIGKSGKFSGGTFFEIAPDFSNTHFVPGYDFVNDDTHPNDDEGHGTHVTGTIAQSTNNGIGVAGVAFNTSIMPIKVLDSSGYGTYTDIADGIYFAANNGAKVINMSLGGNSGSITLETALAYAYGLGVTIVCASGNDGASDTVSYPAAYDAYCIAVGATRYDETKAYYSNSGAPLDLVAPGGDINVDQNGDGYGDGVLQQTFAAGDPTNFGYYFYQGTSMATPHVSGVAALLVAFYPEITPDGVREALQSTARDKGIAGWDKEYGWGIVDAQAALNYSQVPNNQPQADTGGPYSGTEDVAVNFDGSSSYDLDEDSLTYRWDFGDGTYGSGASPSHVYTAGGTYTVTLVVNDGKQDSEPDETTAIIEEVNDPPVADAGPDQTAYLGDEVVFDGSGSYDIDDGIDSYIWNFGDGKTGNGLTATHSYSASGQYTVTLEVTDTLGAKDSETAIVEVTEQSASPMHVESIQMDTNTRAAGKNVFVNAIATVIIYDSAGNPLEGATVNGHWSGATLDIDSLITDANGLATIESDNVKNPNGSITFTFTVDDLVKDGWIYDDSISETSSSVTF
jgi:serine protease